MDRHYWFGALKSFARNCWSTPRFVKIVLRDVANAGVRFDTKLKVPTDWIFGAFPDAEGIEVYMDLVAYRRINMDPMEQYLLGVLTKLRQPRRVFEIGTFDGSTTLLLARNAPQAQIMTLDLPSQQATVATVVGEMENASIGVGRKFLGTSEEKRIEQLYGDSRVFDFSPWYGLIDLVVVDAGHEYDCVKCDSVNAYRLCAPGGLIVWDDYTLYWPGVVQAIEETLEQHPGQLVHIANTDIVVYEGRLTCPTAQSVAPAATIASRSRRRSSA